jgi:dTDP-4-dehydrorhamnose reductase
MRVTIVGAEGQLGCDAAREFGNNGDDVVGLTHEQIEVTDLDSVAGVLSQIKPDLVVNVAAMHHVERCEQDPKLAFAVNAFGPRNLATVAQELNAVLIHVSTDYVFDGAKKAPYHEGDAPRPLNTYGNSKLAGEYYVRSVLDRHMVLRTSALYGANPCRGKGGLNFVELMLKLGRERGTVRVVNTEEVTPTSTRELARQMVKLSRSNAFGLFHATAEGSCSWHDFAVAIFATAKLAARVEVAGPSEFSAKVPRPGFSVLENCALKARGLNGFRPWQEGLREYIGEG